jgi:hypothetical protein
VGEFLGAGYIVRFFNSPTVTYFAIRITKCYRLATNSHCVAVQAGEEAGEVDPQKRDNDDGQADDCP